MRRRTTLLLATPVLAGVVLVLVARLLVAPLLRPALGYAAKVACSGVFVGGASVDQVREGFPDPRLRDLVRLRVHDDAVDASLPLIGSRRALHRPGYGCTLVPVRGSMVALPAAPYVDVDGDAVLPWPEGEAAVALPPHIDGARLAAAIDSAFMEPPDGPAWRTHAVVVVHGGRLVAERYAPGYSERNRFNGWSMTKSVTSALAGVLAADGVLDLRAAALHPLWRTGSDPRAAITLEQLLHMSSGLEFDETYSITGGAARLLFDSEDVAAAGAAWPLAHEPGTRWYYSSATTNMVSFHLRELIGDDGAYAAFPARRLFHRIGMRTAVLEADAAGTFVGSSFMYATARDWARFGLLYLRDGVWNGERVLPAGWVEWSLTPAPAAARGLYGGHWWLNAGAADDTLRRAWPWLPRDVFWASGFQGQRILVVPSHDLVVVRLGLADEGVPGEWDAGVFLRSIVAAFTAVH